MKPEPAVLSVFLVLLEKLVRLEKKDLMADTSGRCDRAKLAKAGAELTIIAALSSKTLLVICVSGVAPRR